MGLESFVESAKKFHTGSKQTPVFSGLNTTIMAPAKKPQPIAVLGAPGTWRDCKHLVKAQNQTLCRQFQCNCKKDACPSRYRQ